MKITELRQKSREELTALLKEWRPKFEMLMFSMRQGKKVKNVKEAGTLRKDIARILTIIKDRPK